MRHTRRYLVRLEAVLAIFLALNLGSADKALAQDRTHGDVDLTLQLAPPLAGKRSAGLRIPSLPSSPSKIPRRDGIIEPNDQERSEARQPRAWKWFDDHDCTSLDIAVLTGSALVDYLVTHTITGCLRLFLWDFNQNLAQVFTDANMQTVFLAVQDRVPAYDGTHNLGFHQLWYFVHAGYFHEFYETAVGPFNDETRNGLIAASRDFEQNSHIYDLSDEAADILGEWIIILDNPGVREHFIDPIKQVLRNMTPDRATSFAQRGAYNSVFFLMFRGIANNDQDYQDALVADGEMISVLKLAARYEFLYPGESYLIENAIGEMTRLATIESFREEVVAELTDLLPVYPRLSSPYLKVVEGLNQYVDCAQLGLCSIRDEVIALVFPNRFVFDDGAMVVETPLDQGVIQILYHAAKQAQSQFFRLIESINPLPLDVNETIIMRLYGSRDAYETYQGFLYNLPTDNGGIYIESGATFYTYQRTRQESIYTLEELFRHEYIHYLAGRFVINGSFGATDFYQNCGLTWFDEGLAEFLAGSTQADGVQLRRLIVERVSNDGEDRMTVNEIIGACYSSGFTFYRYSSMLFSYLYEERRGILNEIVDLINADDLAGYNNLLADLKSDANLETAYQVFIDQKIAVLTQFQDPTTRFPALVTLTTEKPSEVEFVFRDTSGDSLAACSVNATEINHRFGCYGELTGTDLDAQIAGSANHYFNEVLDSWIAGGNAHPVMNNFDGMNCHFGEITDSAGPTEGDFATLYSCIGPLRDIDIALDSDQDGTPDSLDDFPFDYRGWRDDNGNGLLDPEEIPDSDGDGMPDGYETMFGFDLADASDALDDADSDSVDNVTEYRYGTDPLDSSSTPPTVDLRGYLRNDSYDPRIDVANSVVIYVNLRFSGDQASNTQLIYSSSRAIRVENILQGSANCAQTTSTDFDGTLDCGTLTDGPSGLDIFFYLTPLQACQLDFTIEWTSDEVELAPGDNTQSLSVQVEGCPSEVPPVPVLSVSDSTYSDRVELSWTTSSGASYYEIFRGTRDDSTAAALLETVADANYVDSSLVSTDTYYYWVRACNDLGCSALSPSGAGSLGVSGVDIEAADSVLPNRFGLLPNYPNPFNPSTIFRYDLPQPAHVTLKVYNMLGREIATLVDEQHSAGRYTIRFDASGLPSGVYLYHMTAGAFRQSRSMVLIR